MPGRVQPRAQPHRRRSDRRRPRRAGRCSAGSPRSRRSRSAPVRSGREVRGSDRRAWPRAAGRRAPRPRARGRRSTAGRAGCRSTRRAARASTSGSTSASGVPGSVSGSSMIPAWSVPSPTSSSARIIPSESSPRTLRCSSCQPVRQHRARAARRATVAPTPKFQAPQTIVARLALAHVDLRQLQPVGVRVLVGLEHAADAEELEVAARVGDAAALDPLDLGGRDREPRRPARRSGMSIAT